mgnify:CR=1 FL=1
MSNLANLSLYLLLIDLVGKLPVYRAGGLGLIPDRANTQGLKFIFALLSANG